LPSISGTTQQGDTLTADHGTRTGTTPITYTYAWSDGATARGFDRRKPAGTPQELGEAELLRLRSRVPEGGDHDELVAVPLGGLLGALRSDPRARVAPRPRGRVRVISAQGSRRPCRLASSRAHSPRRPAEWLDSAVLARGELAGAPNEPGVDLGGLLLVVERRYVALECGGGTGSRHALQAAKRLEPLDQSLARETYLEALTAVLFPAHLAPGARVLETARAARAAPLSPQPSRGSDLLLDGLALLITNGYAAGAPTLKRAVNTFRGEDMSRGEGRRWLWLASRVAAFLWDDEAWDAISARFVQLARDAGELSVLPLGTDDTHGDAPCSRGG
jgi:hypothetical protein